MLSTSKSWNDLEEEEAELQLQRGASAGRQQPPPQQQQQPRQPPSQPQRIQTIQQQQRQPPVSAERRAPPPNLRYGTSASDASLDWRRDASSKSSDVRRVERRPQQGRSDAHDESSNVSPRDQLGARTSANNNNNNNSNGGHRGRGGSSSGGGGGARSSSSSSTKSLTVQIKRDQVTYEQALANLPESGVSGPFRIFVGNLYSSVKDAEVREIFSDVNIASMLREKGCTTLTIQEREDAARALTYQGTMVRGDRLNILVAKNVPATTTKTGNNNNNGKNASSTSKRKQLPKKEKGGANASSSTSTEEARVTPPTESPKRTEAELAEEIRRRQQVREERLAQKRAAKAAETAKNVRVNPFQNLAEDEDDDDDDDDDEEDDEESASSSSPSHSDHHNGDETELIDSNNE